MVQNDWYRDLKTSRIRKELQSKLWYFLHLDICVKTTRLVNVLHINAVTFINFTPSSVTAHQLRQKNWLRLQIIYVDCKCTTDTVLNVHKLVSSVPEQELHVDFLKNLTGSRILVFFWEPLTDRLKFQQAQSQVISVELLLWIRLFSTEDLLFLPKLLNEPHEAKIRTIGRKSRLLLVRYRT